MALSLRDRNEEMYIQPFIQNLTQVLSLFHYYYYSYLCYNCFSHSPIHFRLCGVCSSEENIVESFSLCVSNF